VKKRKIGQLTSLFTEGPIARLLKEEDDSISHETGASGDSLDAQVDRYLGQYEGAAKKADDGVDVPSVDQMEALDWRDLMKGRVLLKEEGQEDNQEDQSQDTPEDAAPGADAMTGADDDASKLGLDQLNVEAFANDVVRLIENYDSLLEVRSTLIRRAKSFLEKTYNDEVVQAFENTLRDDHGMEAGKDPGEIEADRFSAPAADRANGTAEPGAGGGAPA